MKIETDWLGDALSNKDVQKSMTHYRVKDHFIQATNGRIIAGHPCDIDGEFLVPGVELERILKRLPDDPKIDINNGKVTLRSGRFHGSLQTLDLGEWLFEEVNNAPWQPIPNLLPIFKDLRPFISENAVHRWAMGIAITDGWALASNNIALAGAKSDTAAVAAIIPSWVIDFIMQRRDGIQQWAVTDHYMAFRWASGAWMRSTLIDDKFPERAAEMIKQVTTPTQPVSEEYRDAVLRVASLSEEGISIYKDRVTGRTAKTELIEELSSEVPKDNEYSRWGEQFIEPVMAVATAWQPSNWPQPASFVGERVRGVISGRR